VPNLRITAVFGLGVWSFYAMYAAFGVPLSGQALTAIPSGAALERSGRQTDVDAEHAPAPASPFARAMNERTSSRTRTRPIFGSGLTTVFSRIALAPSSTTSRRAGWSRSLRGCDSSIPFVDR
jgi:hypothetical protein